MGVFEVREKNYLFSTCWARLAPGTNYQIEIAPALYEQLRVGSRLRLVYTAGGHLISLTRLAA